MSKMLSVSNIIFWKTIFSQHGMFLMELLDRWMVPDLYRDSQLIETAWKDYSINMTGTLLPLLDETIRIKQSILYRSMDSETPINVKIPKYHFEELVSHMLYEVEYVRSNLLGQLEVGQEIQFYKEEAAQHTYLMSDSIVNDMRLKRMLEDMISEMRHTQPSLRAVDLIVQSRQIAADLLNKIQSGEVVSLMTPLMLIHEMTETMHGEEELRSLGI